MSFLPRLSITCAAAIVASLASTRAAEPVRIVFQGGRMVPIEALELRGNQFVVTSAQDGIAQGQTVPVSAADHVFGDKPAGLDNGIALLLMDDPVKALGALEPLLVSQKITAAVPGNFWVETARAAVLAYGWMGNAAKVDSVGKELAEATKSNPDPAVSLAKVLLMPVSTKIDVRLAAFNEIVTDASPPDVAAYGAFYRALALVKGKRDAEALESNLSISCLYPTGNNVVSAAGELAAADALLRQARRDEASALLHSASRDAHGTAIDDAAKKRLESLK